MATTAQQIQAAQHTGFRAEERKALVTYSKFTNSEEVFGKTAMDQLDRYIAADIKAAKQSGFREEHLSQTAFGKFTACEEDLGKTAQDSEEHLDAHRQHVSVGAAVQVGIYGTKRARPDAGNEELEVERPTKQPRVK